MLSLSNGIVVGVVMSMMMIRCPHTGEPVATGIDVDAATFIALPDVLSHSHCPHCNLEHSWWKHEAWIEEQSRAS